jgi:hypothetical protein
MGDASGAEGVGDRFHFRRLLRRRTCVSKVRRFARMRQQFAEAACGGRRAYSVMDRCVHAVPEKQIKHHKAPAL